MSTPDFIAYRYDPSIIAPAIFTGIFAASTLFHAYQSLRTRTYYMIPLILGDLLETAGYASRIASSGEAPDFKLPAYIVQSLCILVAPAFIAATIYMVLSRIVLVVNGRSKLPLRQKLLTLTFVSGDIVSFMVQSTGETLPVSH